VAAHARGPVSRPASGRHFLLPRVAAEVVAAACLAPGELVLDAGAGSGRLTEPLAASGARVLAVERDPVLAAGLRRRFPSGPVAVVEADVLALALPRERFRVVANLPFAAANALLRRLFGDPRSPLTAVDVIVQEQAALKRCRARPATLAALVALPWWTFRIERQLPASCFQPPPSVDAALLCARRRPVPLLDPGRHAAYSALLRRGFARPQQPLRRTLGEGREGWKRFASGRGLALDARPPQLDVWDWVALLTQLDSRDGGSRRRTPGRVGADG
jgi:23S rRNA (adenine-N6)-dimethyltransferase